MTRSASSRVENNIEEGNLANSLAHPPSIIQSPSSSTSSTDIKNNQELQSKDTRDRFVTRAHAGELCRDYRRISIICCWCTVDIGVDKFWDVIIRILPPKLSKEVLKVQRFQQLKPGINGVKVIRYNMFMENAASKKILKKFQHYSRKRKNEWYVRQHIPYWERKKFALFCPVHQKTVPHGNRSEKNISFEIGVWNINRANEKRELILNYLLNTRLSILALNETHIDSHGMNEINFKGFKVFDTPIGICQNSGEHIPGQNGLAIIVRNDITAKFICSSANFLVVEAILGREIITVISVYIPPLGGRYHRKAVKNHIFRLINDFNKKGKQIMVVGDFNMQPSEADKWSKSLNLQRLIPDGDAHTFHRKNGKSSKVCLSALDHMLTSVPTMKLAQGTFVDRENSQEISDHYCLRTKISCKVKDHIYDNHVVPKNTIVSPKKLILDTKLIQENKNTICDNNYWLPLLDSWNSDHESAIRSQIEMDEMASEFEDTTRKVCSKVGICRRYSNINDSSKTIPFLLSRRGKNLSSNCKQTYKAYLNELKKEPFLNDKCKSYLLYNVAKQNLLKEIRNCKSKSRFSSLKKLDNCLRNTNIKEAWQWIREISGYRSKSKDEEGPLMDGEDLKFLNVEKIEIWEKHYCKLFNVEDLVHRDFTFWKDRLANIEESAERESNIFSMELCWDEINCILATLKNHKAPGTDGIPAEFFKCAIEDQLSPSYDKNVPKSTLGKVILTLANAMLSSGIIPTCWKVSEIVNILKKNGDGKLPNNYRGISLIPSIVKITVSAALTNRIQTFLERKRWFCSEQAGFRGREECGGHVTALYEVISRRLAVNQKTFVCFLDFKQAYDRVPVPAMIHKMMLAGVDGATLKLLMSLYDNRRCQVRTSYGTSSLVEVMRGLRQGCPGSPLAFNVFINDFFDGLKDPVLKLGVNVPGMKERLVGLLFADDGVIWASSICQLRIMLGLVSSWSDLNLMEFGINKCAVLGFGRGAHDELIRESDPLQLQGQTIPIQDSYDYLGTRFTNNLCLVAMVKQRAAKGWATLSVIEPFLGSSWIPIFIRVNVIKMVLIPILSWGAELWGMSDARVQHVQDVLDTAVKALMGLRKQSTLGASSTLMAEFGISSLFAVASGNRVRAFTKFPSLRTTIGILMNNPMPNASRIRDSWVYDTKKKILELLRISNCHFVDLSGDPTIRRRQIITLVEAKRARSLCKVPSSSFKVHHELKFGESGDFFKDAAFNFPRETSTKWLIAIRCNLFPTSKRLKHMGYLRMELPNEFRNLNTEVCPWCENPGSEESMAHLCLECPKFCHLRDNLDSIISNISGNAKIGDPNITNQIIMTVLCGGKHFDPVSNQSYSFMSPWTKRAPSNGADTRPLYIQVSFLFESICKHRNTLLHPFLCPDNHTVRTSWLLSGENHGPSEEPTPKGRAVLVNDGD